MGLTKSHLKVNRPTVTAGMVEKAATEFFQALDRCIKLKGDGAFVSLGEIRGYLDEEVVEFHNEQHRNQTHLARMELMDIAVAAIWGVVSIDSWERQS